LRVALNPHGMILLEANGHLKLNRDFELKFHQEKSIRFASIMLIFYWAHGPRGYAGKRRAPTHESYSYLKK
jgi:hypothetical protein